MSAQQKLDYTAADYLAIERQATERSEFINGEIFAMAGASRAHNTLTMNIASESHQQLKSHDCQVYSSDMRVKIGEKNDYVYPDVVIACEPQQFDDNAQDNLLNPSVIIEVLSKSTESYDRDHKFALYRQLLSLQHYILVSQNKRQIEHYQRQSGNQWLLTVLNQDSDQLHLSQLDLQLSLADIYAKVDFG